MQISSAVAWLEHLDCFHGDLRPPNILLDAAGDVKTCDFVNTTRRGGKNPGATAPFHISDTAGPASEQFAIFSCIFAISKGHEPLHELDYNGQYEALYNADFPTIEGMMLGCIIFGCWLARYDTLDAVRSDIISALQGYEYKNGGSFMQTEIYNARVAECQEFVERKMTKFATKEYFGVGVVW